MKRLAEPLLPVQSLTLTLRLVVRESCGTCSPADRNHPSHPSPLSHFGPPSVAL